MKHLARNFALMFIFGLGISVASAQVTTGTPPFGSFGGGLDVINLANLNAQITVPILHKPGRGTNFTYDLRYDSSVWYPVGVSGSQTWQPAGLGTWGWSAQTEAKVGYISADQTQVGECGFWKYLGGGQRIFIVTGYQYSYQNWIYHDQFRVAHPFSGFTNSGTGSCSGSDTSFTNTTNNGSGYTLHATGAGGSVTSVTGTVILPNTNVGNGPATYTDRNGNQLSANSSGQFFDTLSSTAQVLTVAGTGTPTSPYHFTYTPPAGGTATVTMNFTQYTVNTYFHIAGINEYGRTSVALVSSIVLPDNSQYTFTYEATPSGASCLPLSGTTSCVTSRIASVALPTGGTISYAYSFTGCTTAILSDGSTSCLQRSTPDGTWTYAQVKNTGAASTTTVTAPQLPYDSAANHTVIQFQGIYETQRKVYQGSTSGTLLTTLDTCYNVATSPCTSTAITLPITQRTVIATLPGSQNLQSKHSDFFNTFGMPKETDESDFGSGAPSPTGLRQVLYTYAPLSNITAFKQTVTVKNGSGTTLSQTTYNYDEGTVAGSSGTPQHTSVTGSRGNLTSIHYPVGSLTKNLSYYDTGTLKTSVEVNGQTTTFNYPGAISTCGNAFPTSVSITQPISMSTSTVWNCTGGIATSATDGNSQITTANYTDTRFWRPANVIAPDGGQTSFSYNNATSATVTTKTNSTQNTVGTVLLDGLGRIRQTQLNSDPDGVAYVDTTYDALGRVASVSNPYRTTSDPTYGVTSYQYDSLGRTTKVIPPDGTSTVNNATIAYSDNCSTSTDPAGKKSKSCWDSLGRTTQVFEDPAASNYETDYAYDALNNLLCVAQKGTNSGTFTNCASIPAAWRPRNFIYDSLSRLTSETNPESGTITYTYGTDGNLLTKTAPKPNQTGSATVTTTYAHDALNRLTQKSYSDGTTLTAYYVYDQTANWIPLSNTKGRMTEAYTQSAILVGTIFSYDSTGRVTQNNQLTPADAPSGGVPLTYTYDLAGDMTSYTTGVGVTFTQALDSLGRVTQLTSSLVDAQHPATLATVNPTLGYFPNGAIRSVHFGNTTTESMMYNNRLQPCRISANDSNTTLNTCTDSPPAFSMEDLSYGYNAGTANNGNVASWSANGWLNFNRSYGYDQLNRLSTMADTNNTQPCKGLSWTYDAWGNRTDQTVTSGSCGTSHVSVGTNNRLLGAPYQYDAAGNLTGDGSHIYTYDAENRLIQVDGTPGTCSTASACYTYDALGRRVEKTTSAGKLDYIYDLAGNVVTEWLASSGYTGWARSYIYLYGQQIAEYAKSTTYFMHKDHLGSTRLVSDVTAAYITDCFDFYPFGEPNVPTTPCSSGNSAPSHSNTTHEFTGDERDAEIGLDHTQFRQYSSSMGRWSSPDPAGLAAVSLGNPQSFNRYAYVQNNPLNLIDPLGLDCIYAAEDGSVGIQTGDCTNAGGVNDSGVFVDATIDTKSPIFVDPTTGNLSFGISNDSGGNGTGIVLGFFDPSQPSNDYQSSLMPALVQARNLAQGPMNVLTAVAGVEAVAIVGVEAAPTVIPAARAGYQAATVGVERAVGWNNVYDFTKGVVNPRNPPISPGGIAGMNVGFILRAILHQ